MKQKKKKKKKKGSAKETKFEKGRTDSRSEKERKIKIDYCCAFFLLLLVTENREEDVPDPPVFLSSSAAARGATCRYYFDEPRMHPRTVPEFLGLHFVNFKLFNVIFI